LWHEATTVKLMNACYHSSLDGKPIRHNMTLSHLIAAAHKFKQLAMGRERQMKQKNIKSRKSPT